MNWALDTPILSIVGTTASGKSSLAIELGRKIPRIEIVSIDSMQIYRGMDIGTAKPTFEERKEIPHHLVDVVDPSTEFSLSQFQEEAKKAIAEIEQRGAIPLLVGGTALNSTPWWEKNLEESQILGNYTNFYFVLIR